MFSPMALVLKAREGIQVLSSFRPQSTCYRVFLIVELQTVSVTLLQTGVGLKSTTQDDRPVESERVVFTGGNGSEHG